MKRYGISAAIVILAVAYSGCKKTPNTHYAATIPGGKYVWMGSVESTGSPACYDAFLEFDVTVVDDTTLVAYHDTMRYISTDPSTHELVFKDDQSYGMHPNYTELRYNPAKGTMQYTAQSSGSYGGGQISLSTASYQRIANMNPHVAAIQGGKSFAGPRTGTVIPFSGPPVDTTYTVNQVITFIPLTDSTISISGQILPLGDSTLYYKSNDPISHLVVWQTHHSGMSMSTLTFNYVTNQLVFEQLDNSQWSRSYVKMQ
jgi:hypothetical protein